MKDMRRDERIGLRIDLNMRFITALTYVVASIDITDPARSIPTSLNSHTRGISCEYHHWKLWSLLGIIPHSLDSSVFLWLLSPGLLLLLFISLSGSTLVVSAESLLPKGRLICIHEIEIVLASIDPSFESALQNKDL
jgi:hypothetical protein